MVKGAEDASAGQQPSEAVFDFQHRVFSLRPCIISLGADGQPSMRVSLDGLMASIPIKTMYDSFGITADSHDGKLLALVNKALKYIKEIRPGDSIPTEILDGKASWMIDPKHLAAASARISMQIFSWLSGKSVENLHSEELMVMAENPEIKQKVQQGFAMLAEKLGYDPKEKEKVVDLVEQLAQELSYIEALRDQFDTANKVMKHLKDLAGHYRREQSVIDNIVRAQALLRKPIEKINERFEEIDGNLGEILPTLRDFPKRVAYIRKQRDQLRERYLVWEDILALWNDIDLDSAPDVQNAIRETYRFAAQKFPQTASWTI